jgi:alkenylglycerophosphocholine hydrolase
LLSCAIVVCGALAIAGTELNRPVLAAVFKPLTTILLFAVVGLPSSRFAGFVTAGIVFSLIGDVALLSDAKPAFIAGLAGFLLAHVAYISGSLTVGTYHPRLLVIGPLVLAATALLLKTVWPGAGAARIPVLIYGLALSTMVITAWSTLGSALTWAPFAAAGSVLFYISDSSLALNRFHQPIPHVSFLSMGVYWLGQLGIALAAHGGLAGASQPANAGGG